MSPDGIDSSASPVNPLRRIPQGPSDDAAPMVCALRIQCETGQRVSWLFREHTRTTRTLDNVSVCVVRLFWRSGRVVAGGTSKQALYFVFSSALQTGADSAI